MKPKHILIPLIILAEIGFLAYTSHLESPSIDYQADKKELEEKISDRMDF